MPPRPTGNVIKRSARLYARVRLDAGPKGRRALAVPVGFTETAAQARADIVADLATRLREGGVEQELAWRVLTDVAGATEKALDGVRKAAEKVASGEKKPPPPAGPTFQGVAERWTSGELARLYPDHIKTKSSADTDRQRLGKHVYPYVGGTPIAAFELDDAERVMSKLPSDPSAASTRRHVAQLMGRVCSIAVFPLRLIKVSPLPKGFLPKPALKKAQGYVYPDEDRTLLACIDLPLCWRVFFGFLHREGMRSTEATRLIWAHLDLERGAIRLDKNKTHDARAWPLASGVAAALRTWKAYRELLLGRKLRQDEPVFINQRGGPIRDNHLAEKYREQLRAGGITRPELFEKSAERRHIVLHSTRSAFVTVNLATGMPEMKIADRTGHKDTSQIARYRRQARTVEELDLGAFAPLDEAVPELAAAVAVGPANEPGTGSGTDRGRGPQAAVAACAEKPSDYSAVRRKGLEPLQELPHWNLNQPGAEATRDLPEKSRHVDHADRSGLSHEAGVVPALVPAPGPFLLGLPPPASAPSSPGRSAVQRGAMAVLEQANAAAARGDSQAARVLVDAAISMLGERDRTDEAEHGAEVVNLSDARRRRGA